MGAKQTDVERVNQAINNLKRPNEIRKINDLRKLLEQVKRVRADYQNLSTDGRRMVEDREKLNEILKFFCDKDQVRALQEKLVKIEKTHQQNETEKPGFRVRQDPARRSPGTVENVSEQYENEPPPVVPLARTIKTTHPDDYVRSENLYVNPQTTTVQKAYEKQHRELTNEEKKEQLQKYKKHSDIIKENIEELIPKYRDIAKEQKERLDEATQSGLYVDPEDIDEIVLPGEDSSILYDLELPEPPKKQNCIEKMKNDKNKRNRVFKHRKSQVMTAANHHYDGYYEDTSVDDDEKVEKKKYDKFTLLKGGLVVLFIIGCVIGSIIMILNL